MAGDPDAVVRGHVAAARRDRSVLFAGDGEREAAADVRSAARGRRALPRTGADAGAGAGDRADRRAAACSSPSAPRRSNRRIGCFRASSNLQGQLPGGWELGITISLPTDVDILRITEVYREARDHELLVAFDEFQGNGGQVMHLESLLPDYLVLAANMTKDLTSTRQPLRRLESLLAPAKNWRSSRCCRATNPATRSRCARKSASTWCCSRRLARRSRRRSPS